MPPFKKKKGKEATQQNTITWRNTVVQQNITAKKEAPQKKALSLL